MRMLATIPAMVLPILVLSGCASTSPATTAVDGYRRVEREGQVLFCRPDEVLGSKVRRSDVCYTEEQLAAARRNSQEFMRQAAESPGLQTSTQSTPWRP